jgi:hypothetical protein
LYDRRRALTSGTLLRPANPGCVIRLDAHLSPEGVMVLPQARFLAERLAD